MNDERPLAEPAGVITAGSARPPLTNLRARLLRAVDALHNGEEGFALQVLEDLLDELDREPCDICNTDLGRVEALDARSQRRRGYAGACAACLDALSVRAA
jgi:hypothetical protein